MNTSLPIAPRILALVCIVLCLVPATTQADDAAGGFRALLDKQQRETLAKVGEYVRTHPEADDVEQASAWMFETAIALGLEADVVAPAEQFLRRQGLDQASVSVAQQALCVGLARVGKRDEALAVFDAYLKGVRFQTAFRTLDVASSLSAQFRLAGDLAGSRDVFERVAAANPLNAQLNEIVRGRIARQELIGQPAPRIPGKDTEGKPIDTADYAGKVVLVDFWATTCAPCLAEFPNLRQIYKDLREKGLEIIGVSFDESADTAEAFRARAKLPWRMVLDETQEGTVSRRFNTRTIPALFLVDRKGNIAQVDIRGNDLRTVIETLLAQ